MCKGEGGKFCVFFFSMLMWFVCNALSVKPIAAAFYNTCSERVWRSFLCLLVGSANFSF